MPAAYSWEDFLNIDVLRKPQNHKKDGYIRLHDNKEFMYGKKPPKLSRG